jgi:hypothetical protein
MLKVMVYNAEGTEGEAKTAGPTPLEKTDGKEDWRRPS